MALIKCNECGSDISDKASACPKCGFPLNELAATTTSYFHEKSKRKPNYISRIVILVLLGIASYYIYSYMNKDDKTVVTNTIKQIANQPVTIFDSEEQIQEDNYLSIPVELSTAKEVTITYNVTLGPSLDVFFMDSENFQKWKTELSTGSNENVEYITALSTFGLSNHTKTAQIAKGTYYAVFDNTDYGPTHPPMNFKNDIATIKIQITEK